MPVDWCVQDVTEITMREARGILRDMDITGSLKQKKVIDNIVIKYKKAIARSRNEKLKEPKKLIRTGKKTALDILDGVTFRQYAEEFRRYAAQPDGLRAGAAAAPAAAAPAAAAPSAHAPAGLAGQGYIRKLYKFLLAFRSATTLEDKVAALQTMYPLMYNAGVQKTPAAMKTTKNPQENVDMIRLWDMCLSSAVVNHLYFTEGAYQRKGVKHASPAAVAELKAWMGNTSNIKRLLPAKVNELGADFVCVQEQPFDIEEGDTIGDVAKRLCGTDVGLAAVDTADDCDVVLIATTLWNQAIRPNKDIKEALQAAAARYENDDEKQQTCVQTCLTRTAVLLTETDAYRKTPLIVYGCHWKAPSAASARVVLATYADVASIAGALWTVVGDFNFEEGYGKMGPYHARGALSEQLGGVQCIFAENDAGVKVATTDKCRTDASSQGAKKVGKVVSLAKDGMLAPSHVFEPVGPDRTRAEIAVQQTLDAINPSDHRFVLFTCIPKVEHGGRHIKVLTANCGGNSPNIAEFAKSREDSKFVGIESMVNADIVSQILTCLVTVRPHLQHAIAKYFAGKAGPAMRVTDVFRPESEIAPAADEHKIKAAGVRLNLLTGKIP